MVVTCTPGSILINQSIVWVFAWLLPAEISDDVTKLAVSRTFGFYYASKNLGIAFTRALACSVTDKRDFEVVCWGKQQLRAQTEVVKVVEVFICPYIINCSIALRS